MGHHFRTDRAGLCGPCGISKGSNNLLAKRSPSCASRIRTAWRRGIAGFHTHSADKHNDAHHARQHTDTHTDYADARANNNREHNPVNFIADRHLHTITYHNLVAHSDTVTYCNTIGRSSTQTHSDAGAGHFDQHTPQSIC